LIRQAGLATHVPANGIIASGGVDFYLASTTHTYEAGAQFGVHSWATTDGTSGADVPSADPDHQLYLDYYAEISIARTTKTGPSGRQLRRVRPTRPQSLCSA